MWHLRLIGLIALLVVALSSTPTLAQDCGPAYSARSIPHSELAITPLFAMWRWVEESLNWLKSFGMDRSRLVQLWLLFMIIGLYIIMRIKPKA